MKPEQTDEERAAMLEQDKLARRERNPLKDNRRTTQTRPAVIQKPQPVSTPRGPNRDKGENRG